MIAPLTRTFVSEYRFRYEEIHMSAPTHRADYRATFAVLATGVVAYALLQSLVMPVLPTLQAALRTSQGTVTWVLTAYLLSASIFTPIMGRIGDMVGKKRIFVVTLIALAFGSLLAALAPNVGMMIIARVVQGIGGGVLPLAFGIVRDEFPLERVSGAVGVIASLAAVGAGAGAVIAGPIVDLLSYRWLFWLPMIVTLAAAAAAFVFVPESPVRTKGRISWVPAFLLSGWLVALLVALSEAPDWGWGSGKVLVLLVLAVVIGVGWVASELRAANPLIDMNMMRQRAVWTTNLVSLLLGVGMYAVAAFLPELVQTPTRFGYGFGASITQSGLLLLPSSVTMFFVGLYTGHLSRRIGAKWVILVGCAIGAFSVALMAFAHGAKWELYLASGIQGLGMGAAFTAMSSLIVAAVRPEQTGVASGMNANIRTIGGSIGAAVMGSVVTGHLQDSGVPKESGYTAGFAALAAALLAAAVAALLIPIIRHRPNELVAELPEDEPEHGELAMVAGGTVVGDKPE
jgi:EmrB/QacA subfamily drug resistance transporter